MSVTESVSSADVDRRSQLLASIFALEGKVVIVTGASSGLGRHFARTLHTVGASVVLVARRAEALAELAQELGERAHVVVADVTEPSAAATIVDATLEHFGRLDILVNNAGRTNTGMPLVAEERIEDFKSIVDLNVTAMFQLSQRAGAVMLDQGAGAIVNVGSMFGIVAPPGDVAYAASKAAVSSLTRGFAVQWARSGVRVNCLAPGFIETDMTTELAASSFGPRWVGRRCPTGRLGRAEELDGALLLLCSPAGSYLTGQVLAVDGGWTAA